MEFFIIVVLAILLVYFVLDKYVLKRTNKEVKITQNEKLPYKVSDSIMSDAERSFYHTLKLTIGDKYIICPKVGLKDLFFIGKGIGQDYMKYFGKISQKHVDFLLCEPNSMKPLYGIELDDVSHTGKKSYERDLFVEKVYKDASLPLVRVSSKSGYSVTEINEALASVFNQTPQEPTAEADIICPKCNIPMVLRKASKGKNVGKEFYGCVNYPKCREVAEK